MASPKVFVPDGFTLIEIIFVMTLWSSLLGLGLVISFDSYRGHIFQSETKLVLNYLYYARALSMANANSSSYGVQLTDSKVILFSAPEYNQSQTSNIVREDLVSIGSAVPTNAVFAPLTGQSTAPVIFELALGNRNSEIRVNGQGGILW